MGLGAANGGSEEHCVATPKEPAAKAEESPLSGDEILLFAANRAKLLRPLGLASCVQAGGWLLMLVNGPALPR